MTRALIAGLLLLFGVQIGAPAGAAEQPPARTIDEMVAQLRTDPVLVQPTFGTGDTQGVHDMLTELVDDVDLPVFVVFAATPPELDGAEYPAEQGAALLREELGDGLYIMKFDEGIAYAGGFGKADDIQLNLGYAAIRTAEKTGPQEYGRTTAVFDAALLLRAAANPDQKISDAVLSDLMDQPWAFIPTDSYEHADKAARRWVYTIAAGLAVLIAGLILSRIAVRAPLGPRTVRKRSPDAYDTAYRETSRVQDRFNALTPAELGSVHATAADEAIQAARAVIDTGKYLDEVGAVVLALIADREMDRISRPSRQPYRPCVIDPTHGEAAGTVRLSDSTIDAPACLSCTKKQGAVLVTHTWRGNRPYLDTNTVWARTGFGALVDDLPSQVLGQRGARA